MHHSHDLSVLQMPEESAQRQPCAALQDQTKLVFPVFAQILLDSAKALREAGHKGLRSRTTPMYYPSWGPDQPAMYSYRIV